MNKARRARQKANRLSNPRVHDHTAHKDETGRCHVCQPLGRTEREILGGTVYDEAPRVLSTISARDLYPALARSLDRRSR